MEQHGVRARGHAARAVDALGATGAGRAQVQEHGAGGSDRQTAEKRLENRCVDSCSGRQGQGALHTQDDQDRNVGIALPGRLRHPGPRSGQFHDLDVRAQPAHPQAGWVRGDAGSFGAARAHLPPLQGVLERRALKRNLPKGAARSVPARFFSAHRSEFGNKVSKHDESLLRNHLPVLAALPHRAVRKGHGLSNHRRDMYNKPEDIAVMNPYNRLPVLVERDLILYEANIINEYIDERFPHPQLMPADPVMRARARLFLFNFEVELFSQIDTLEHGNQKQQDKARQHVADRLAELAPVFTKQKYMLGDEFSMLDVAISPLLWRLDYYGVSLPKSAAPLVEYAERLFSRPAFIEALTPSEKVMRK